MFLFRRCKLPSLKLALVILLLWLLVAAVAWAGLVVGFDTDQIIKHARLLAYFTFFSAVIPTCIHYAMLRRGSAIRIERVVLGMVVSLAISAVVGKAFQMHRESQIVRSLYYDWDGEFLDQCEFLQKEQRYAEMVVLLEQECTSYQNQVAAVGGLKELVRIAGRPRRVIADGTSDLFCGLQMCIDYNTPYTPMNVEYILMRAMPYQARKTRELQEFAAALSQSREPMLQAYGLWMLERHVEYRDFVYSHADQGKAWAYGFAADATNHDPNLLRSLDVLDRYQTELQNGIFSAELIRDALVYNIDPRIAHIANALGSEIGSLSPRQTALVNQVLDRSLQTVSGNENPKMTRLFTLMNRSQEAQQYLSQIQQNSDKLFRGYMVEMLLEKSLSPQIMNQENISQMHQVLDEHLRTGATPGISSEQMRRIFGILGRGDEFEAENR